MPKTVKSGLFIAALDLFCSLLGVPYVGHFDSIENK